MAVLPPADTAAVQGSGLGRRLHIGNGHDYALSHLDLDVLPDMALVIAGKIRRSPEEVRPRMVNDGCATHSGSPQPRLLGEVFGQRGIANPTYQEA
jgi:hypothetical protein